MNTTNDTDPDVNRAVLIGGMPRSGTNLARRVVGSHSKIAIPGVELDYFAKAARGLTNEQILSDPNFRRRYKQEVQDLVNLEGSVVYRHLLTRYAAAKGKPIPGEKTPFNEFYFRDIKRCFADADLRFIHMVRNPFDVVASFKNAPFRGANPNNEISGLVGVARNWVRSAALASTRALMEPRTYCMIRFEDLTNETERVATQLCTFLGVELEKDRMVSLTDYEGQPDNTSFTEETRDNESDHRIKHLESRKDHLALDEVRAVGSICGELAQALGYEDPDFERTPPPDALPPGTQRGSLDWLSEKLGLRPTRRRSSPKRKKAR